MRHPRLIIEKTAPAERCNDSSGSYRIPAEYCVTGPTGTAYHVQGTAAGYYQSPRWRYSREAGTPCHKGGFRNMTVCLSAIDALEQAPAAAQ